MQAAVLRLLDLRMLDLRLLILRHLLLVLILLVLILRVLRLLILPRQILALPPFRRIQIQCFQRYTFSLRAVCFRCRSKRSPGRGKLLPLLLFFALNKLLHAAFLQHIDLPVQPLF